MTPTSRHACRNATCAALAAALGLGIGWLDLHTTEVSVTILALLLAGLLLGLLEPAAVGCYTGVGVRRIGTRRVTSG